MAGLEHIVETNDKKRFVFNGDASLIRAAQGHSKGIAEDKEYARLTALQEEMYLYHGTDHHTTKLIEQSSIMPGKRQYVHWTQNIQLAEKRARQIASHSKGTPALVILRARSYIHGGGKLLMAENQVYLTPAVNGKVLQYEILN
jgi:putative RNA 2'-phosphotransferase